MGDIDTIWFVAGEEQARALLSTEASTAFNPFTKETLEASVTRFDAGAASKLPCLRQEWLLGEDVADLLGSLTRVRPEPVNGDEDELWRMPDELVAAFAKLPESSLPAVHAAWCKALSARKAPKQDEAVVRRLHGLAREAIARGESLYGFVEASGR